MSGLDCLKKNMEAVSLAEVGSITSSNFLGKQPTKFYLFNESSIEYLTMDLSQIDV